MIIEKYTDQLFGENTYLIADKNTREGAVIDPGGEIKDLMKYIKDNFIQVKYIILTHGHGDHIGCVKELKEATNACIIAHEDEKEILLDKKKNLSYRMNCGATEFDADKYVNDGDSINLGELKLKFI
ncbi:MAG: MBL fold metallo-hydrolase, partial [Paraclostridium sp.]